MKSKKLVEEQGSLREKLTELNKEVWFEKKNNYRK
jgi:hypothetical protein